MTIQTAVVEVIDGQEVSQIRVTNKRGTEARFLTLGATWQAFFLKATDGRSINVILGHDKPSDYLRNGICAGQTVGRVAGRIKAGQARLGEAHYQFPTNHNGNTLHGGPNGLHRQNWDYELVEEADRLGVRFSYRAQTAVDGFPGDMTISALYLLDHQDRLSITYEGYNATTDTLFNPTNHVYFNLGEGDDLSDHHLFVAAHHKLETDQDLIPTGERLDVTGTPYDFRQSRPVMAAVEATGGLDDAFEVAVPATNPIAILTNVSNGQQVTLYSERNALVIYSFNWPEAGVRFSRSRERENLAHEGLALEAQTLPDAVNHPDFGSIVLKAGERVSYTITYEFDNVRK